MIPPWLYLERVTFAAWVALQPESAALLATKLMLVITGCSVLAFVLIVTELSLLALTSSVTLAVCGIAKELLLIAAAVALFGDELSALNLLGFFTATAGVSLYKYTKLQSMGMCGGIEGGGAGSAGQREAERKPLLSSGDGGEAPDRVAAAGAGADESASPSEAP